MGKGKQLILTGITLGSLLTGGLFPSKKTYAYNNSGIDSYQLDDDSINYYKQKKTILIDPGHGGNDAGAVNPNTGEKESVFNMEIALNVKRRLEEQGYEVILTRYYHKDFYEIYERVNIANQGDYDFFLSIHNNASETHKGNGVEAYYNNLGSAKEIANNMVNNICNNIESPNRGTFVTPYFNGRINTPSILIECEFVDNEEGLEKLKNMQDEISKGIVDSIVNQV